MAKTTIRIVQNLRANPLDYQNLENGGCNRTVPPQLATLVGCDVPWVNNESEYRRKHLELQDATTGQIIGQIWSRDLGAGNDLVRFSTTGWSDPGNAIAGNPVAGGRPRILVVDANGGVRLEDIVE